MSLAQQSSVLEEALISAAAIWRLWNGDVVLISEGCIYKRQCKNIGAVKLPKLFEKVAEKRLRFCFSSGHESPGDMHEKGMRLMMHCDACILGGTELLSRFQENHNADVPTTNYGVALTAMQGMLSRATTPLLKEERSRD